MSLPSSIVDVISQRVASEYPEMRGIRPAVSAEGGRYSLVYKTAVSTPAGKLSRIVRVVADEKGKVLRMSTSK
jgi:hypothetical protein